MSTRGNDLGRERSRFVFDQARKWRGREAEEITSLAQGLPVTLRSQGLVVTMARLAAKDNNASATLNDMIFQWLSKHCPWLGVGADSATPRELLETLMGAERASYLAAQREAMALSERIKLLSKAFLAGQEKNHGL